MPRLPRSNRFAIVLALVATGACAQIDGLSGLKYDQNADAGGATSSSAGSKASSGSAGATNGSGGSGASGGAGGSGTSATGSGGSAGPCGSDAACVKVPSGWSGPIIFFAAGASAMTCPSSYSDKVFDGGTMPAQDSVTCNACACDAAACGSFQLFAYESPACANEIAMLNIPDGSGCTDQSEPDESVELQHTAGSGGCNASGGGIATKPAAHFTDRDFGCGLGGEPPTCNGGTCAPNVPNQSVCIYQQDQANSPCPPGFPSSTTVFTSIDDTRGCTPCACGPSDGNCSGELRLFDSVGCTGSSSLVPPDGMCHPADAFQSVRPTTVSPCTPAGGTPTGMEAGATPVTVCCQ